MKDGWDLGRTLSYICEPSAYLIDRSVPFELFVDPSLRTV